MQQSESARSSANLKTAPLALAALGVVFGDIGTSPLYTLKTCFLTANATPSVENTLGILSLLTWALIVVVCIKYVTILMRVDQEGEGGILALLSLAAPPKLLGAAARNPWVVFVVVIGATMLLGDGMITPAISVISAIEGIGVETTAAQPFIVPISAGVLLALFLVQSRGTQRVGGLFGPFMILWFAAIGVAGLLGIARYPAILAALNPAHAVWFVSHHGWIGFTIFGAVILAVTGAEALYADLAHFGRRPITIAWYGLVLPALLLNYFGQGATLVANPATLDNPFYALASGWALWPMVLLATVATVIASQALISAAFTLAEQAIAMNLCPRFLVMHTSMHQRGQVYVPFINAILAVGCLLLVFTFRSSDALASAYGLAVAVTMLATSLTLYVVMTKTFGWKPIAVWPWMAAFIAVDAAFVASGLPKFASGAWIPLAISAVLSVLSFTWLKGRRSLAAALNDDQIPIPQYLQEHGRPIRMKATTVLLTRDPNGVPFVKRHGWMPMLLEDKKIVILTLSPAARPYIEDESRVSVIPFAPSLVVVKAQFGYMEQPRLHVILHACRRAHLPLHEQDTTFFYAVPAIVRKAHGGMWPWQRGLFRWLQMSSRPLTDDLQIPPDRRVGLGVRVAI